jgi:hypothetical protein
VDESQKDRNKHEPTFNQKHRKGSLFMVSVSPNCEEFQRTESLPQRAPYGMYASVSSCVSAMYVPCWIPVCSERPKSAEDHGDFWRYPFISSKRTANAVDEGIAHH